MINTSSKNIFFPSGTLVFQILKLYRYLFTNVYFVRPVMPIAGISVQHTVGHGIVERKQSGNDNTIGYLWRKIQGPAPPVHYTLPQTD